MRDFMLGKIQVKINPDNKVGLMSGMKSYEERHLDKSHYAKIQVGKEIMLAE